MMPGVDLHVAAGVGAGFLVAVLWFDLMFDVQVRGHRGEELPPQVLASIAGYYRRVTTGARPMNLAVPAAMALTVGALVARCVVDPAARGQALASLALTLCAVTLALAHTVGAARRLASGGDPPAGQSRLARAIFRDHLFCLAAMSAVCVLQIAG